MSLAEQSTFYVGCNYWASHAGTAMWRQWNEEVVRRDFKLMSQIGLQVVRVFPLWPDFQPLELHRTALGLKRSLQLAGKPLSETESGRAGVSDIMMERFRILADIAEENKIKLIVGLITSWMSGELHVSPAFCGMNVLTDPMVIKWQVAFVRYFVKRFKHHPAIDTWELGNECNCMAPVENQAQAWLWTNTIVAAIRAEDSSRLVASGMHGIHPGSDRMFNERIPNYWLIRDQGELCDLMTSHPYPHSPSKKPARVDPVGSMRSNFQAVVESRMYADMGGKPCLVEEIGTFGPMVCDEKTQADFINSVLWSTWAHDCRGLVWWCGFEQVELEHSPYEWNAWERELGLFRKDYSIRPVAETIMQFKDMISSSGFKQLPPFRKDAVCILPYGLDASGYLENSWSCFLLAKQAGFDVEFQYVDDPLRESNLYILPGLSGPEAISRSQLLRLTDKVKAGATLYLSLDDGHLSPFNEFFGLRVENRQAREDYAQVVMDGAAFKCSSPYRLELQSEGAKIVAEEVDGNPAFTCYSYGKGKVWLMTLPIERYLAGRPNAFAADAEPYYYFYQKIAAEALAGRLLRRDNTCISVTEHFFSNDSAIVVMYNNSSESQEFVVDVKSGWEVSGSVMGDIPVGGKVEMAGLQGVVLQLDKVATPAVSEVEVSQSQKVAVATCMEVS